MPSPLEVTVASGVQVVPSADPWNATGRPAGRSLFVGKKGGPLSEGVVRTALKKAASACGISKRSTPD